MQFNSYGFIFGFMPLIILAYFLLGRVHRSLGKLVIIAGSILFYAYTDRSTLVVFLISLGINYLFARMIGRQDKWRRAYLLIPVVINAGLLLYFKYTNFAISNVNAWFGTQLALKDLVLPIGISFFTFQQIAYLVAVYRGEIQQPNLIDYVAFITYFPKLLMGPLMDPVDFVQQFNDPQAVRVNWDHMAAGIKIFSFGLAKKVLLADTFAAAVTWGFSNPEAATAMDWILVTLCYTFEIYFDFSGYSDMAVGVPGRSLFPFPRPGYRHLFLSAE